jgi:hypothetical protein
MSKLEINIKNIQYFANQCIDRDGDYLIVVNLKASDGSTIYSLLSVERYE